MSGQGASSLHSERCRAFSAGCRASPWHSAGRDSFCHLVSRLLLPVVSRSHRHPHHPAGRQAPGALPLVHRAPHHRLDAGCLRSVRARPARAARRSCASGLRERHVDRAFAVFRKYGLFAVAIPSILPPPVPFKMFVLTAGAARVRPLDFLVAVSIGRGVRYFGEGLLALWYGQWALDFLRAERRAVSMWLAVIVAVGGIAWMWWSRRRRVDASAGSSV